MSMDKGTLVRLVFFALTWINTWLATNDMYSLPVINEEGVAIVVTFVIGVWVAWKNNNITDEAKIAQKKLDVLKENKIR